MRQSIVAALRISAGSLILLVLVAAYVRGQTLTTLASFSGSNGQAPINLTFSGSTLYGTTNVGGNLSLNGGQGDGTVFSVPVTGGSVSVLASFNGSNGQDPFPGVTLVGTTLYGTTVLGGSNNDGTVFSVPASGGSLTVLTSFGSGNGQHSYGGLMLNGGKLYGTTNTGGANSGVGTVFSMPLSGGNPTVLASFNGNNGEGPYAGLMLNGSTLYGTTEYGGAVNNGTGDGTVFSVPLSGGNPTMLASFSGSNGSSPYAGLTLIGTTLYGATFYGGVGYDGTASSGDGTVFSVPVTGGSVSVLASFNGSNGMNPECGLTLIGDTMYGTTQYGGNLSLNDGLGDGTVFSVPLSGGNPTTLYSFSGSDGQYPIAGFAINGDTLYGTTARGGVNGDGTVFALDLTATPEPSTFALLATGAVGILGCGFWRRSRRRRPSCACRPPNFGAADPSLPEDEVPATLPFRSTSARWRRSTARAA